MRILQLKAARGWSGEQAAQAMLVDEQTLRSWLRRIDEEGERALIQIPEPVNKFPDFVRYLVKQLKTLLPAMGNVRIAQVLARAGLHLGSTTVRRILNETEPVPAEAVCVAVVIDHFPRAVVGFAVFARSPTSAEMQRFLDRATRRAGDLPKYIIADKGRQSGASHSSDGVAAAVSDRATVPPVDVEASQSWNGSFAH